MSCFIAGGGAKAVRPHRLRIEQSRQRRMLMERSKAFIVKPIVLHPWQKAPLPREYRALSSKGALALQILVDRLPEWSAQKPDIVVHSSCLQPARLPAQRTPFRRSAYATISASGIWQEVCFRCEAN